MSHHPEFCCLVKIAYPVSCVDKCNQLQGDITKLLEWNNLCELKFNEKKCRVMHFHFRKVFEYNYYLNNHVLTVDTTHKGLGIVFSANLMWGPHFKFTLSRAYKVLGLLRRVFSTIQCAQSKSILYLTLVRPHSLYCSSLWRPHLLSDIQSLDTMQRRATKFIIRDSSLDYKERLMNSNLLPLIMEFEIRDILFFLN